MPKGRQRDWHMSHVFNLPRVRACVRTFHATVGVCVTDMRQHPRHERLQQIGPGRCCSALCLSSESCMNASDLREGRRGITRRGTRLNIGGEGGGGGGICRGGKIKQLGIGSLGNDHVRVMR